MTRLIVAFRNFANAPKNKSKRSAFIPLIKIGTQYVNDLFCTAKVLRFATVPQDSTYCSACRQNINPHLTLEVSCSLLESEGRICSKFSLQWLMVLVQAVTSSYPCSCVWPWTSVRTRGNSRFFSTCGRPAGAWTKGTTETGTSPVGGQKFL